jgi:signal transduction histidine kinase
MSAGDGTIEIVVTGNTAGQTGVDELGEETTFRITQVEPEELSAHLAENTPDAVVVADDPPASDGVELFRTVRDAGATLPVVLVGTDPDRLETALSAGVTDYVTGDWAELAARIRAHVRTPVRDGFAESQRWDAVVGSLAHDIKNPLNVVSGRLELLEVEQTHAEAIERSLGRVASMLDELSVAASTPTTTADPPRVAVAEAAERVWSEIDTNDATLTIEAESHVVDDIDCIAPLFERLFENAIQHGGEGVSVTVGDLDGGFYVADDGPGVPADMRERIFEQGYGTVPGGEGYGLFVADRVATANGWAISVGESETGGARFEIRAR